MEIMIVIAAEVGREFSDWGIGENGHIGLAG